MAGSPFGPWRQAVGDEASEARRRPLYGTEYDDISLIYEAAFSRGGMGPREVDELEMWELGSILGANHPPDGKASGPTPQTQEQRDAERRAWNARRVAAMEAGQAQPEHSTGMDPELLEWLQ